MNASGIDIAKNAAELKELELNALLEVTQAINNNLAEESLYKIFKFILMANLQIGRMALFIYEDQWRLNVHFGLEPDELPKEVPAAFLERKTISFLENEAQFAHFDVAIPVTHKSQLLAYVFLGGVHFHPEEAPENYLNFIQALSNILIVAVENKRLARARLRQEAFKKEMEIAKHVQSNLLPDSLPNSEAFNIHATYIPNRLVGGDYYDCISLNEHLHLFCVADVSGKGVPAALLMANFQASLRTLARQDISLQKLVEEINVQICHSAKKESFITVFLGVLDLKHKELRYINAGHNPPLLLNEQNSIQLLDKGTTILGMFDQLPFIEEAKVKLSGLQTLMMYTDGLSETINEADEMFGDKYVIELLQKLGHQRPEWINQEIMNTLNQFKGKRDFIDDITILTSRFQL